MRGTFRGSWVALPTPFRNGRIDHAGLARLVDFQVRGGSDGLVAAGSTGESVALSPRERMAVIEFCAGAARGRLPVLAGIGSSDTRLACELALSAERAGAAGLLVSTPAYNRPQQRGLARHFAAIADASSLPVVLYNIPSRTGVDLLPATVRAIVAESPSVVAIKEASASLDRIGELVRLEALDVLCGEDAWIADSIHAGAAGVIGVVANVVPGRVSELVHALLAGDARRAPAIVEELAPLVRALFLETNPVPVKAALELMGLCSSEVRLPLVGLEPANLEKLQRALDQAGVSAIGSLAPAR